jgi:hypothetical protein
LIADVVILWSLPIDSPIHCYFNALVYDVQPMIN